MALDWAGWPPVAARMGLISSRPDTLLLPSSPLVPVVHPVAARCWEIQRRFNVRQPIGGYGRLLAKMPEG